MPYLKFTYSAAIILIGIGSAFAQKMISSSSALPVYGKNIQSETFVSVGALAADQNINNYFSLDGIDYSCIDDNRVCSYTYDISAPAGSRIKQDSEGLLEVE
ncbi:hypothetical protein GFS24_28150 [Chitinophaga sp. SYP-B3965]|uniref:hypothetical protein n=1 Tax=Chitinophaga sp. SYP-B3965 TaxID=2663120 RepID=UPI001299FFEA|nr:hypothetical protein [Chitinophaga sp. SYP-B3965]MRG49014.1 hypothetical protein [Chitinophaga sp. SYP-B3965]